VTINTIEYYPQLDGTLSECGNYGIVCTKSDILQTFETICEHSIHSYAREISQGYVTIEGGNRVGICGSYIFKGNELHTIKDLSSINIRVSHEVRGSANEVFRLVDFSKPKGLLIVGKPLSGKTTILRDLCRLVSHRYKVSLIDERSEIACTYDGIPQSDVGLRVDTFNGYPKSIGIESAIRTMSPDMVFCDEIGTIQDYNAIRFGAICGVKFVCTAHADSIECVLNSPKFKGILDTNAFDNVVLLGGGEYLGKVLDFRTLGGIR
jgi:stage III sporulation protein AA